MNVADARALAASGGPTLATSCIDRGLVGDEAEVLDARGPDRVVGHGELDERRIARTLLRAGGVGFVRGKHQDEQPSSRFSCRSRRESEAHERSMRLAGPQDAAREVGVIRRVRKILRLEADGVPARVRRSSGDRRRTPAGRAGWSSPACARRSRANTARRRRARPASSTQQWS